MNVVGEKCVWLQNKERIDTHNNTVMMLWKIFINRLSTENRMEKYVHS